MKATKKGTQTFFQNPFLGVSNGAKKLVPWNPINKDYVSGFRSTYLCLYSRVQNISGTLLLFSGSFFLPTCTYLGHNFSVLGLNGLTLSLVFTEI